ncbi:hypothetical protein Tco_0098022 [Tanacetum coccineum]
MDLENYKEGHSMQRPPLFEVICFIYLKNRFETYVKSKDIDLWHLIVNGDYKPMTTNLVTGKDEAIPYDKLKDENKNMLSKNDKAKMILYNALPKKEYERIFMCKTDKDIWNSLVITYQAKKVSSDQEASSLDSNDEEYAIAVRDFKKFFRRRGKICPSTVGRQKGILKSEGRKESDEDDDPKKDEICLMAHDSNEFWNKKQQAKFVHTAAIEWNGD